MIKPLTIASVGILNKEVVILEVRDKNDFIIRHISLSLLISLDVPFAKWVGVLFALNDSFLLVFQKEISEGNSYSVVEN